MLLTMARNLMQGAVMGEDNATYHGKEPDAGSCDGVDNATYHGKEPDAGSCDGGRQCYLPWQGT